MIEISESLIRFEFYKNSISLTIKYEKNQVDLCFCRFCAVEYVIAEAMKSVKKKAIRPGSGPKGQLMKKDRRREILLSYYLPV